MARTRSKPGLHELGHRFGLVLLAALLSDIGSQMTQTAVALYIFRLSGQSTTYMGISMMANFLPFVLASPFGGVCAERYNRKWVMICNDLLRIPLVLLLGVTHRLWGLLGLQAGIVASTAVFLPSRQSIIPELVEERQLNLANSLSGGVGSLMHVFGPVLGALLFVAGDGLRWVVLLDASSYAVSALLLLGISYRRKADPQPREGMLSEILAGLRYLRGEAPLSHLLFLALSAGTAVGIFLPLLRPFVTQSLHRGDATYAQLIGAFGLGGLIGPFLGYLAGRHLGFGRTVLLGFFAEAMLMIACSRGASPWVSSAVLFVWGATLFAVIPCQNSYLQTYVDKAYLGRTFALMDQASYLSAIVGAGIVVLIGGRLAAPDLIGLAGVLYLLVVALSYPTRGARALRARRPAPDPTPLSG